MSVSRARRPPSDEAGFSLVAVIAGVTIMMTLMGAAVPAWRYVMKDDREEELFFRGNQIASAVERYQRKNGNALPPSIDTLVKGRFLRKAYRDPMTKDGAWRIIHPGEAVPAGLPTGAASPSPRATPRPTTGTLGSVAGVASTSAEKSLKLFNGRTEYDQWLFVAGQPRVLGIVRTPGPGVPRPSPGAGVPTNR